MYLRGIYSTEILSRQRYRLLRKGRARGDRVNHLSSLKHSIVQYGIIQKVPETVIHLTADYAN